MGFFDFLKGKKKPDEAVDGSSQAYVAPDDRLDADVKEDVTRQEEGDQEHDEMPQEYSESGEADAGGDVGDGGGDAGSAD